MNHRLAFRLSTFVVLAFAILGFASTAAAQSDDDPPSGGGMGCVSQGTCTGTVYKDKDNLNSWWYPICSGCHFVPSPRSRITVSRTEVQRVLSNPRGFWTVHEDLKQNDTDVQANRTVFSTVVAISKLQPEYARLMRARIR